MEIRNSKIQKLYKALLEKKKEYKSIYNTLKNKYNSPFILDLNKFSLLLVYEVFEYGLLSFFFRSYNIEEIYIGTTKDKGNTVSIYLDHRKYSRVLTDLTLQERLNLTISLSLPVPFYQECLQNLTL